MMVNVRIVCFRLHKRLWRAQIREAYGHQLCSSRTAWNRHDMHICKCCIFIKKFVMPVSKMHIERQDAARSEAQGICLQPALVRRCAS